MNEAAALKLIERFGKKQAGGFFRCPRCGSPAMDSSPTRNALSRRAMVYVCDRCGTVEAIEDMANERMPLTEWCIARFPEDWYMEIK